MRVCRVSTCGGRRRGQRRASAREWVRTSTTVTVGSYARRYGVDRYTAYEDLTVIGFVLPVSAQRWSTWSRGEDGAAEPDEVVLVTSACP